MKNNLLVLFFLLVFLGSAFAYYQKVVVLQPDIIEGLRLEAEDKNKKLLAAQILSEKREGINMLIQNNLIDDPSDSLAEKSSIPFLRYLTSTLDKLGIRLVSLTPLDVIGTDNLYAYEKIEFIEVPYELTVISSYKEIGEFLDVLEKSPHLIKVISFTLSNEIDKASYASEISGKPNQHSISLRISTLAILKASYKGELGEYN